MIHIDLMYISMISILAPTILGAALFNRFPRELKILSIFIFGTCFLELVVYIASLYNVNNMAIFHLFTYMEFGCISLIYYEILKSIKVIRRFIISLSVLFAILSIYILFEWESLSSYNSMQRGLEHVFVLMYIVQFINLFSKRQASERFLMKPYFILSLGFIIYFSGTFLIFLDANRYIRFDQLENWSIHSLLNIMLNTTYFIVLWMGGKRPHLLKLR